MVLKVLLERFFKMLGKNRTGNPGAKKQGLMPSFAPDRLILVLFLLMYASCSLQKESVLEIQVSNELDIERNNETVVIGWSVLKEKMPDITPERIRLIDRDVDREIIWQTVDKNNDKKTDEFIFQANFEALGSKNFLLQRSRKRFPHFKTMVSVKQVSQGMDDFNWENDRIGYRMYGAARKIEGVSSGIDIWCKRVPYLIIDKWYQPDINYHEDTGEGADFYKVGASRGCGGTGIWSAGKLFVSDTYSNRKIIANGPIRSIFELAFDTWSVNGYKISEIKRITFDAGQNLNRFDSVLKSGKKEDSLSYAIGIVKHNSSTISYDKKKGSLKVWESLGEGNGELGCTVLFDPQKLIDIIEAEDHYLVIMDAEIGTPITYYSGAGWTESNDFADMYAWDVYLDEYLLCIKSPLKVQVSIK